MLQYKIKILGSGSSGGVPTLDKGWGMCNPSNPKNNRTRTSAMIEIVNVESFNSSYYILFDVSPDFRQQCLQNNIKQLNSILFTHHHADHIYGIDEIRGLNRLMQKGINAYCLEETLEVIKLSYAYIFDYNPPHKKDIFYRPVINFKTINFYETFYLTKDIKITTTLQDHGRINTVGYIINDKIGYATDFVRLPKKTLEMYKNLDFLVFAAVTRNKHPSHMSLDEAIEALNYLKPKRAVLTHMAEGLDYDETSKKLPKNIEAGYDGLEIIIK